MSAAPVAPVVDTHAHVYTLDMPLAGSAWHKPPQDAPVERYVETLAAHGVTHAVLSAASLYGDYNDYQIDAVRRFPHLRTTVIVKPTVDRYILEMMKRDGVVGIRFQFRTVPDPPDLTSPDYRMLLRRVADLDWHVHLHDEGERLARPIAALESAGVKLVIDHFGRPQRDKGVNCDGFQAVLRAIERGRTWVKLSAGYRQEPPSAAKAYAQELLKTGGAQRLFWASDWPFAAFEDKVTYRETMEDFRDWLPDNATRHAIHENAYRFYFG